MFADQMRKQRPGESDVHVWSLEFDHDIANVATELIALAGLQNIATVVKGPAADSMRDLKTRGALDNIDFLFIDHVEELYEADLQVALDELKLLKQGAVVVADNILRPGAPKYREYVRSRKDLKSEAVKGLLMPGEVEVTPQAGCTDLMLIVAGRTGSQLRFVTRPTSCELLLIVKHVFEVGVGCLPSIKRSLTGLVS